MFLVVASEENICLPPYDSALARSLRPSCYGYALNPGRSAARSALFPFPVIGRMDKPGLFSLRCRDSKNVPRSSEKRHLNEGIDALVEKEVIPEVHEKLIEL